MADKSPRQSASKKSGKSLKEKRAERKGATAGNEARIITTPRPSSR
jgi:hypothetical protein